MDLRQYFTKKVWWGKMIGSFFGFLMAGPIGAIFGLLIGNFFDHGLVEHFSNPFWHFTNEKNQEVKEIFFKGVFSIMGHVAKSGGQVSTTDIHEATTIMESMRLNPKQRKLARKYFTAGKAKDFNLYDLLHDVQKALKNRPPLIRLFIDTNYNYIKQTGVSIEKLDILNNVLASLGMAPIQRQSDFQNEYSWYDTRQRSYRGNYQYYRQQDNTSYQNNYSRSKHQQYATVDDCYSILGVANTANQTQVKRAYRKQISRNHPDKLIARGASEQEIKAANEKTSRISAAYEQICEQRGWK